MKISKPVVITLRLLQTGIVALYRNICKLDPTAYKTIRSGLLILSGRVYVFRYAAMLSIYPKDMVTKYNHINWLCHAKITLCL